MLAEGKIVGWFQGRMEIGPRALGNRSILANPILSYMKDKINAEVKHREAFRPFAPSVPVENKDEYFDIIGESPFMLKVCPVKPEMRQQLRHHLPRFMIPDVIYRWPDLAAGSFKPSRSRLVELAREGQASPLS